MQVLIDHGLSVNALDATGETPLDLLKKGSEVFLSETQKECISLLEQHGGRSGEEIRQERSDSSALETP